MARHFLVFDQSDQSEPYLIRNTCVLSLAVTFFGTGRLLRFFGSFCHFKLKQTYVKSV